METGASAPGETRRAGGTRRTAVREASEWEAAYLAECQRLRVGGVRVTKARLQALRALGAAQPRHVSAEGLFRSMLRDGSDVTLCTLYRVLTEFVRAGLACSLTSGAGKLLYEHNDKPAHHHLSCVRCGGVTEVFDDALSAVQARIAQTHRFASCGAGMALHGLCQGCATAAADAEP